MSVRNKIWQLKANMKYRTKQECNWSIDEMFKHFNNWEGHGILWQIDHIHPVFDKLNYDGNINDLSNLQQLTIAEHCIKSSNERDHKKMETVWSEQSKKYFDLSTQKLYDILEDWDFDALGKMSIRKVSKNHPMSTRTVAKYWGEFKEYVEDKNNEYKLNQQ